LLINAINDSPTVVIPISDVSIFSHRSSTFTISANTFQDADIGDALSYAATFADGTPLPAWLTFSDRTFSGNPATAQAGAYDIKMTAADQSGAFIADTFILSVVNSKPTNILLDNNSVPENSSNGTVVGRLSATDNNLNDSHSFELINSAGGRFAIADTNVIVADGSLLDFEAGSQHSIRVRATDNSGLSFERDLLISLTNLNDGFAGVLSFAAATFNLNEAGSPAPVVSLLRSNGSEGTVSVNVVFSNGTATFPADYSAVSGLVVFGPGETSKTLPIAIVNDAVVEGDETIILTLASPSGGASLGAQVSATLTIVDNDFPTIPSPTVTAQITNDSTPLISGTADVAISNQFRVSLNGRTYSLGSSPELVLTGTSWSLAIPAAHALGDGLYNVVATVQDPNGSSVSDASNGELRIDTVAPLTTLTSAASPLYFPLLQGRSEPGAVLQVSCGGASWSLSVPADGNWQLDTATTPLSGSFAPNRDGANPLTISATDGAGNSSLFSGQLNILYPYPDLRISAASLNSGASLDTVVLDYTVVNNTPSGPLLPGHIASGSWIDRFYLSPDAVYGNGNDLAIGPLLAPSLGRGQAVSGPLSSGASTTTSLNVQLPEYPGSYYLIAVTDADRSLAEGVGEANNVFISAAPITVAPIYTASVSTAVTNLNAGQSISLSGQLVHTTSSVGVAGKSVTVVFINDTTGQRFERQLTSGADGGFSFSFTPSVEQAGAYRVAARYSQNPAEDLAAGGSLNAEDSFRVQGLAVSPGTPIVAAIAEGATYSGNLQLRNSGADALTLSDLSVSGAPSGWSITLGTLPASLAAGASTTVSYQVSAPNASVLFDDFELIATAAASGLEPLSARQPLAITILPNRPVLGVAAAQRSAAMLLGQRTLHEVTISNSGNASTGALNVVLPGGAPWLSLYGSPTLAPLAAGASTSILLALDPPADLALATYQASIGFLDEVHPADSLVVPFSFRATSSQSGSVSVAIYDEFSSAPSYPTVNNVSVRLYDRIDDSLLQAINDADGRFSFTDLPVGEYAIEVRADRHASSWQTFRIDPGDAEQLDVFLPSEFVRYSWVVVPTTVQDRYLITLEATFETEVPVPVVTITPTPVDLRSLDLLNQSVVIPLTITNHGLVAARDLYFQAPTDPNFSFTILGPLTGEVIAAESSLLVDLRIERIAELPNTCTNVELGTLYWDYGTFLPSQVAPITIEKSTPLPFLIDSDCPSPLPPGAPEGGFGGGGGGGGGFPSIPDLITVAPSPVPLPYVTARVKIRIEQEAVLARDGFEGTFILENLDPSIDITNIDIDLEILDEDGNLVNDRFVISSPALLGFSGDLNGGGSVAANSSGTAVYTILAKNTAAPIAATQYSIGGRVSYSRADGSVNFNLAPAAITVLPQPVLAFDYFLQRDVFSDDPFTTSLKEASQPFVLGLLAHNRGYGIANDLVITSAEPEIIENELGLKIGFDLIGAAVNGSSVAPSLSIDLGDLASQSTSEAYWLMTSTLQGRFIDYKASFEYINPLGIKDVPGLSQLTEVNLHELTHRVRDHRPGADLRFDYLVNSNPPVVGQDNTTKDLIPDILYLSNDSTEAVTALAPDHSSIALSAINDTGEASLSFAAASGWTYLRVLEPSLGNRPITAIRRADGSLISADNFWITDRTFPEHGRPTYESSLHILDYANEAGSTSYTLLFGAPITNAAPTLVVSLADQLAKETFPFFFIVPSSSFLDTDAGDSLSYAATLDSGEPLPTWLSFNPATRTFSGTPGPSDAGTLQLNVTATDRGGLAISDSFTLLVEPVNSAPVVSTPIPDQTINTGLPWLYTLPASTFSDPDPTDLLTYSASLDDGSPLPAWLSFDPDSRSFSGTPVDADATNLSIKVVATDPAGAATSDSFALTVLDTTPPVITSITVVGTQLQLQFSEAIVTTGLSSSRFTASVAGANRTITSLAAVAGAPNRLNLTLSGSAPTSSQTLSLRYTDLSTANDASGVVQDGRGNDMQSIAAPGRNVETFSSATSVTSLAASYTNLLLTGTASGAVANSLNNSIRVNQASSVNNVFTGAGGIDAMDAGNGSDIYLITNSNDHTAAEISDSGSGATDSDELRFASTTAGQTLTVFAGDTGLERITIGTGVAAAAVTTATTALHINAAAAPNALTITGNAGNNTLTGSAYNDLLDGAAGLDAMDGTGGSDLYLINSSLHHSAAEFSDSGAGASEIDELRFTSTTANQILTIFAGDTGLERITIGTGTAVNAVTTATTALSINAGSAPNALTITGNHGVNTLTGSAYNDTLTGNNGNDILNGGAGNDAMDAGNGSDLYLIANGNDRTAAEISDSGSGATDSDELRFASTTAGQTLTVFAGDTGLERITIGTGVTAAAVTTATTALNINAAAAPNALTITGNAGNNTLTGSAYNDLLDGAAGLDAMDGTGGSDLYLINSSLHHSAAEISDSGAGAGEIDELRFTSTTANQTLSIFAGDTGLERITIGTGTAANAVTTATTALSINAGSAPNALTITGNNGINTLTGSAYNDTLTGNNGNDILNGGAGNDSLSGGAGADIFRFDSSLNGLSNVDHITDFKSTETDRIQLENSIFSGLPTTGTLAATAFLVGSAALTSAHRILFNTTTNTLLYDPDGSNPLAATAFATLTPGLTLSNSQFTIT
jgi:Ca2+-binding RTX toxin-like protein